MRLAMKIVTLAALAAAMSEAGESTLLVCLPANPSIDFQTMSVAQGYATRIYRKIGLDLRWKGHCSDAELDLPGTSTQPNLATLGIQWTAKAPADAASTVRASAQPFQATGVRIMLYSDRLAPVLQQERNLAAAILGHILAHEIGHVLLRHNNHATEGVMKQSWCDAEVRAMRVRPLRFTDYQAAQIHESLRRGPVTLTAAGR